MTREIKPNEDPQVTRVFVVRHGRTDWNAKKILQGHIDIDINEEGAQQAQKVASHLQGVRIDDLVSSDLCRCVNTSKPILSYQHTATYSETPKLRERDMGKVQGMPLIDALQTYGENFRSLGEQESALIERVSEVYDSALKRAASNKHKNILLCTHGGVITVFTNHLHRDRKYCLGEGITADDLRVPYNTSITVIDVEKATGSGTIVNCGVTEHLGGDFRVKNQLLR
ncbi:phosphoglycerate mutase-like protein [Metschnikowia bicuspidata var. bicuspidata NRRL YB-4993]|uniref:Phosphoglycerate mutase-like protein n=1 Tax=Metschnikowia bicuspidata var. bicuspidata NRRL YB-4993 TaxID=869754 RepID=A0A1A0HED9_9ASCO|nr:phosphoglycerate mutase-like protein [Metschnikowia bicuspidata var. bicuspidata NRRL YB-4993]OBA22267.1 phosphoglycerate mutase-like protein [Metschnikowia bicuspidata var. bicuspidata NRRL YB-4993]